MRCEICGMPADRHHIVTRGAGGSDAGWNLLYLCRVHHREFHDLGWPRWGEAHPRLYPKVLQAREMAGKRTKPHGAVVED